MRHQKRPSRPKNWTLFLVGAVSFFEVDQEERLLDFRSEYRRRLRSGRKVADQFAMKYAVMTVYYAAKEKSWILLTLGKFITVLKGN